MTSRQPHSTNDVTAAVLVPLPLTGATRRPLTKDHGEFRGLLKKKSRLENFHPWIQYTGVLQSSADVQERWPGALATIMPGDRVA